MSYRHGSNLPDCTTNMNPNYTAEHQNNSFVNKIAKLVATLPNLESVHEGKKHIKCSHCELNFSEEEDIKKHIGIYS